MTLRLIVSTRRPAPRRRACGDPRRLVDDLADRLACGARRERDWSDVEPAEQHAAITAAIEAARRRT